MQDTAVVTKTGNHQAADTKPDLNTLLQPVRAESLKLLQLAASLSSAVDAVEGAAGITTLQSFETLLEFKEQLTLICRASSGRVDPRLLQFYQRSERIFKAEKAELHDLIRSGSDSLNKLDRLPGIHRLETASGVSLITVPARCLLADLCSFKNDAALEADFKQILAFPPFSNQTKAVAQLGEASRKFRGALRNFLDADNFERQVSWQRCLDTCLAFGGILDQLTNLRVWKDDLKSQAGRVLALNFVAHEIKAGIVVLVLADQFLHSSDPFSPGSLRELSAAQKTAEPPPVVRAPLLKPADPQLTPAELEARRLGEIAIDLIAAQKIIDRAAAGLGAPGKGGDSMSVRSQQAVANAAAQLQKLLSALRNSEPEAVRRSLAYGVESHWFTVQQSDRVWKLIKAEAGAAHTASALNPEELSLTIFSEQGLEYTPEELQRCGFTDALYDQRMMQLRAATGEHQGRVSGTEAQVIIREFLRKCPAGLLADSAGFEQACLDLARTSKIAVVLAALDSEARKNLLVDTFQTAQSITNSSPAPLIYGAAVFDGYLEQLRLVMREIGSHGRGMLPEFRPALVPGDYATVEGLQRLLVKNQFETLCEETGLLSSSIGCAALLRCLISKSFQPIGPSIEAGAKAAQKLLPLIDTRELESALRLMIAKDAVVWEQRNRQRPFQLQPSDQAIGEPRLRNLVAYTRKYQTVLAYS